MNAVNKGHAMRGLDGKCYDRLVNQIAARSYPQMVRDSEGRGETKKVL